jgi:hypothetical protein
MQYLLSGFARDVFGAKHALYKLAVVWWMEKEAVQEEQLAVSGWGASGGEWMGSRWR